MVEHIQKTALALFLILTLFSALCLLEMMQLLPLLIASVVSIVLISRKDPRTIALVMLILFASEIATIGWFSMDLKNNSSEKSVFILFTMALVITYELFLFHYYSALKVRKVRHNKVIVLV